MTVQMTSVHWQVAKGIAAELSSARTDVNELKKVVSYLCWLRNRDMAVTTEQLLHYLDTLTQHGEVRSNQTPQYYQAIARACRAQLGGLSLEGDALIQVLGWAGRLQR
jgi:hypothetical protein